MALMTPAEIAKSGTESAEQIAFFQWIVLEGSKKYPDLYLAHSIPNGGDRRPSVGARMRAEGVKRGIPDVFIPVPVGRYHGLYLEFKRRALRPKVLQADLEHGGYLNDGRSDAQRRIGRRLLLLGYAVRVAYGWEHGVEFVRWYYAMSGAA
jgi:hypothetical protein